MCRKFENSLNGIVYMLEKCDNSMKWCDYRGPFWFGESDNRLVAYKLTWLAPIFAREDKMSVWTLVNAAHCKSETFRAAFLFITLASLLLNFIVTFHDLTPMQLSSSPVHASFLFGCAWKSLSAICWKSLASPQLSLVSFHHSTGSHDI